MPGQLLPPYYQQAARPEFRSIPARGFTGGPASGPAPSCGCRGARPRLPRDPGRVRPAPGHVTPSPLVGAVRRVGSRGNLLEVGANCATLGACPFRPSFPQGCWTFLGSFSPKYDPLLHPKKTLLSQRGADGSPGSSSRSRILKRNWGRRRYK